MSWVKIDDQLHTHEKFLDCSLAARGLWLMCVSWVGDKETDGVIPASVVRLHAGADAAALIAELTAAELWIPAEDGKAFAFKNYLEYNKSHEQLEEERRATAARQGRFRDNKRYKDSNNAVSNAVTNRPVTAAPVPVPESRSRIHTDTQEEQEGGLGETVPACADAPLPPSSSEKKPKAESADAPLRALMTAYREAMFPNRDADFHRTIPGSEWQTFKPHLKAVHGSGGTPEQMRQATQAALRRWPKRDMVNPRSVAANWTLLLEPDEPPKPQAPPRNFGTNADDETIRLQKRYLDGIPTNLWPELEQRARKRFNVRISTETAYQTMQKLWRNESNSQNGGMAA